jgi:hypothetical protein
MTKVLRNTSLAGIPDLDARVSILNVLLVKTPHSITQDELHVTASRTHSYVGADLAAVVREAGTLAIKRFLASPPQSTETAQITATDLAAALPTVCLWRVGDDAKAGGRLLTVGVHWTRNTPSCLISTACPTRLTLHRRTVRTSIRSLGSRRCSSCLSHVRFPEGSPFPISKDKLYKLYLPVVLYTQCYLT